MTASAETSPVAPRPSQKRLPDFFVVGQFKSGTTALYQMLRRHPEIYLPELKELWFHSPELRTHAIGRDSNKRPETLDEYMSLFEAAKPGQRVGEVTPSYLFSRAAASSIAELRPDARIIAILREPAAFLRSFHLQCVRNHTETEKDLRKALALEQARREGRAIPRHAPRPLELLYSEHLRYVEQLRRYHAVFSPEQVLVLIYDDFRDDNRATVREVLRFIEVDETYPIEVIEANRAVRVRSPKLYQLVRSLYLGGGPATRVVKAGIKAITPQQVRHKAILMQHRAQWSQPHPPEQELMLELRRRFKGEVVALSDYLGRDLVSLWGYDGID
jgi:hypothetical protein